VIIVLGITTSTALGDATPSGVSYMLHENWGGSWVDAEKSPSNSEDDNMCWAAAASNVLAWTGWGRVDNMTTTDEMFGYYQDHWTDAGGQMGYGWQWWISGYNPSKGWAGWSQVDVAGGAFHSQTNFSNLYHRNSNTYTAMSSLNTYLRSGYGTAMAIYGAGGHAITAWGLTHEADNASAYTGVYITDSDDHKNHPSAPDRLRYYEVELSNGKWYLQNYFGSNSWYIGGVYGLEAAPNTAITGDFDGNQHVDVADIDLLASAIRNNSNGTLFDINNDNAIDGADLYELIHGIIGTTYGDADLDGIISFDDFSLASLSFGQNAGWSSGDFDGDGINDMGDFSLLATHYGMVTPLFHTGAVPEPSTSILIALLAPIVLKSRRVRASRKKTTHR